MTALRDPPSRVMLAALLLYLAISAALVSTRGISFMRDEWRDPTITDFKVFYAAGGLVTDSHNRFLYYPGVLPLSFPNAFRSAHTNFFNPPLLALLYAPLTAFDIVTAFHVLVLLMAVVAVMLVALAAYWRPQPVAVLIAGLAIVSYWPVYSSLRLGNMSLLFALCSGLALVALEQKKQIPAGLLVAFLALKPSIALVPLGFVAWLGNRRAIVAALAGVLVFVILPFLLLGLRSLDDYRQLLTANRQDSFTLRGGISGGANYMFNWNGFIARIFETDPKPLVVLPFYVLTAALMIKVWLGGDLRSGWLAAILTTLLALPHMLWYDWVLLLPAGLAIAVARPSLQLVGLLVLLHLCVNLSTYQMEHLKAFSMAIFLATPAAFVLLAYLAFEQEIMNLTGRQAYFPSEPAAPAAPS
jgi:glycosyl transferase family 87